MRDFKTNINNDFKSLNVFEGYLHTYFKKE